MLNVVFLICNINLYLFFITEMINIHKNGRNGIMNLHASTISNSWPILPPPCTFCLFVGAYQSKSQTLCHFIQNTLVVYILLFCSFAFVLFLHKRTHSQLAQDWSPSNSGQWSPSWLHLSLNWPGVGARIFFIISINEFTFLFSVLIIYPWSNIMGKTQKYIQIIV